MPAAGLAPVDRVVYNYTVKAFWWWQRVAALAKQHPGVVSASVPGYSMLACMDVDAAARLEYPEVCPMGHNAL